MPAGAPSTLCRRQSDVRGAAVIAAVAAHVFRRRIIDGAVGAAQHGLGFGDGRRAAAGLTGLAGLASVARWWRLAPFARLLRVRQLAADRMHDQEHQRQPKQNTCHTNPRCSTTSNTKRLPTEASNKVANPASVKLSAVLPRQPRRWRPASRQANSSHEASVKMDLWSHFSAWPNNCSENTMPDKTVKLSKTKPKPIIRNSSFSIVSKAGNWSSADVKKVRRSRRVCRRDSCKAISTAWKAAMVSVL